jgi:mitogen-activated protein kinase 15
MSKEIETHILEIYETIIYLGSGAYGHVWKVKHRSTGKEYALKKIFDAFQNDIDAQRTYREVTILPQLDHENIIKLHEVIRAHNGRDLYLVFEFMETDLHVVLA